MSNTTRLYRECRALRGKIEELTSALEVITSDADSTYKALAGKSRPIVSVGQWRRVTHARKLAEQIRKML